MAQGVDLDLEQVQERGGRPRVACRQRPGPLAQPVQQHFAIAHRTQAEREPAELGAQRLGPLGVEEGTERAQVGAELARRDSRLVHRLGVAAGPDERVVVEEVRDRFRERVLDHRRRRRAGRKWLGRDLGRLARARAQRTDVLGREVRRSGARAAQAGHERRDDPVSTVARGNFDLDLAKPRGHAPAVSHRHLVVDHLGHVGAGCVRQPHALADG